MNLFNIKCAILVAISLCCCESAIVTNEEEQGNGIILTPGDTVVLQCNSTDAPGSRVSWRKNGLALNISDLHIRVENENNSLIISNSVESDCGNYTCIISREEATIAVRSEVKLTSVETSRNVVQGQKIVLLCNVTQGMPLPTLRWFKDSEGLNFSNPRVTSKVDARGIEHTEVTIADAQFEDRAEYTCVATNEISQANETILVRVKDKYAALWPFLGICAEVAVLCTVIFIYEKRRQKPSFDDNEPQTNTENKAVADQEKNRDVRQRK